MTESLLERPPAEWPALLAEHGGRKFHGQIVARWVFRRGVGDWDAMTDIPAGLRERWASELPILRGKVVRASSAGDGAEKVLVQYPDGSSAEAVGMPGTQGHTLCISTQVGCPVRCTFCASGLEGLARNLTAGEILEQVVQLHQRLGSWDRLVVMGMGDAGFNLPPTLQALDALLDEEGAGVGSRRITLSTVAPRGAIGALAQWGRPVHLALSLHAPDDGLRREIIPGVAKRTIAETLAEADQWFGVTGREYTVEYVLLQDVNDSTEQADRLARLLRGKRCHLNLIPYNTVEGLPYRRPELAAQEAFAERLRSVGLSVTLRRSLGGAVDAACGQLRRRTLPDPASASESTSP